jgi:aspartyl/asparaginyl beta-hydroxylase (cupin superfamily)
MSEAPTDARAASAAGLAALERGDLNGAGESFTRAIAAGGTDARTWFGLSRVHRARGASVEEGAALDEVLRLEPRHLPALIAKGDLYSKAGDLRAAGSYYGAVLKLAPAQPAFATEWRGELQRIETACQRISKDYEAHLRAALAEHGYDGSQSARFSHGLDLLLGKRQIYFQQPKHFFYPELPQVQFYERAVFAWAQALERATDDIRVELKALLASGSAGFEPYIQREANRPAFNPRGLQDNANWSAFYLVRSGAEVPANAARCPRTMAALREVPMCQIEGRTPAVLFSLLRPGAHIPPHHGFTNARLVCHLPLIIPPGCALRVGNETRAWREGELLVFDDTMEHEAWNPSTELRVVLIFDVWRPEISPREQALIAAMLAAIDRFGGTRIEWKD